MKTKLIIILFSLFFIGKVIVTPPIDGNAFIAIVAAMNHVDVAMACKKLVEKKTMARELVMPFGDIPLTYEQRYYFAMLDDKRNPKADIFIQWLKQ